MIGEADNDPSSPVHADSVQGGGALLVRKKLYKDVTVSEMLTLRQEGLSNHQIAKRLDVSEATVYRYIGKKSFAVANAEAQNKPCPIPVATIGSCVDIEKYHKDMPDDVVFVGQTQPEKNEEPKEGPKMTQKKKPAPGKVAGMDVLRVCHVYDLKGSLCTYHVNLGEGTVEMTTEGGSLITGMLDAQTIPDFIAELNQILAELTKQTDGKTSSE